MRPKPTQAFTALQLQQLLKCVLTVNSLRIVSFGCAARKGAAGEPITPPGLPVPVKEHRKFITCEL
jgi:hypothetical protein